MGTSHSFLLLVSILFPIQTKKKTNNNSIMLSNLPDKIRKSNRKVGWSAGKSPSLPRRCFTEGLKRSNATRGNDDDKSDIKKPPSKQRKIDLGTVVESEEGAIGSQSVNELSSSRVLPTEQEELHELELDRCNGRRSLITEQAMVKGFGCGNDDVDDEVSYGCLPFWASGCGIDLKHQNRKFMALRELDYSPPPGSQSINPDVWVVKLIHGFYATEDDEEAALNYDWSVSAVAEAFTQLQEDMPPGANFLETLNQMGKAVLVSDDGNCWRIVGNDGNSTYYGNDEAGSLARMTQALSENLLDNKRSNFIQHCPLGCCKPYPCDPEHEEREFIGTKPKLFHRMLF